MEIVEVVFLGLFRVFLLKYSGYVCWNVVKSTKFMRASQIHMHDSMLKHPTDKTEVWEKI